jgi:hypothetical protein
VDTIGQLTPTDATLAGQDVDDSAVDGVCHRGFNGHSLILSGNRPLINGSSGQMMAA